MASKENRWTGLGFLLNYGNTKTAAEEVRQDSFCRDYLAGFNKGLTGDSTECVKTAACQLGRDLMSLFVPKLFLHHTK